MIERTTHGDARVLTLRHGPANALDTDLLGALVATLGEEAAQPHRGLILTGHGSMFSAGLDLLALENADREEIARLVQALGDALVALFDHPRPTIAAINGHAVAGGALLALACDQRIMAEGKGKIGLTESQLGLIVPPSNIEMLRYPLPRPVLEKVVYGGALYPTFKAQDMGLVDTVVEPEELLDQCLEEIVTWTPSEAAFADIKRRLHAPTLEAMERARPDDADFVDRWFDETTQAAIGAAIEKLRAPRGG
ncbi:MAG TPA: enoyl-CoA hydratase/isomerase family protein [Candidatus Krumholzibacteria bacterium]|nr:enoyl-CoA hydratase/isomerase family protein [Candidatus Krumholzibacteria bacterium]